MAAKEARTILDFLAAASKLKDIPRSGWISHGVSWRDVESVADHSYSTIVLALAIADLERRRGVRINVEKVLRMAALHDIAESLTFDISRAYLGYLGKRGERIKRELESAAWAALSERIEDSKLRLEYNRTQAQYNFQKTLESQIVHDADALDILFRVIEYRRKGYPYHLLNDIWISTSHKLSDSEIPSVRKIHKLILKEARNLT